MKKIRMTACMLLFTLTVCALSGCGRPNGTGMADEATTAQQNQGTSGARNGDGMDQSRETGMNGGNAGANENASGTGAIHATNGTDDAFERDSSGNPGSTNGTAETKNPAAGNRTDARESTGVVNDIINDVEGAVER